MNYTEKYHLPQWEESDRVMRTDFNQMCADIENGLAGTKSTLEAKISTAQTAAEEAKSTALTHKNYVIGSYTGSTEVQSINLGFRPKFVVISGQIVHSAGGAVDMAGYLAITGGNNHPDRIRFTDTGFTVYPPDQKYGGYFPNLNAREHLYEYIAFV